jgi:hypothetical protein
MAQTSQLAQAASFTPGSAAALDYLNQLLAKRGVDVSAANAVFGQEGASGGIGDGGHAFGPGQFNDAGGAWTGKYPGLTPEQKNQIAWSPSGLTDLASHVAAVAAGLKGPAAVHAIVGDTQVGGRYTGFERPANESGEIARALASLGAGAKVPVGPGPVKGPMPPGYPNPPWTGQYPPGTIQNFKPTLAGAAAGGVTPQALQILAAGNRLVGLPQLRV